MPRMSKSKKLEWSFFLNDRGRKAYNTLCRRCVHDCKQSFRAVVVVSCKVMIPVFCIQRTAIRQNIDYLKQLIKIFILLFGKLQILFKLIGKLNVVFHTSRAALSASILE